MKSFFLSILSLHALLVDCTPWLKENTTDLAMMERDMANENQPQSSQYQQYQNAGVPTRMTKLWSDKIIPYMISSEFKPRQAAHILFAIAEIQDNTCMQFVQRTNQVNYIYFNHMGANGACSSEVGKVGKRQYVNLTDNCVTQDSILHEMAHVLGFYHEHNRHDRDKFVRINLANVMPDKRYQFQLIRQPDTIDFKVPYDYKSITHYPEHAHSVNGQKTIVSRKRFQIIKSSGLSEHDVTKINLLYKCTDLIPDFSDSMQFENGFNATSSEDDLEPVTTTWVIEHNSTTITKDRETTNGTTQTTGRITSSTTITETSIGTTSKMTTSTTTRPISILNKEIINAVEVGNENRVLKLLNEGADVNVRIIGEYQNNTLLHIATKKGHVNVVSLLLDKGANIEARTTSNSTPLHYAAQGGHANVVSLLLDKGANIEAKDSSNLTSLHHAARYGDVNAVSLLLDQGANIEEKDTINKTPLHYAAWYGQLNVVSLLLDKGANIEAKSTSSETPLHDAAYNGRVNVVSLLLDKGANIEGKNINNLTPLHCAAQHRHVHVVSLLLDKGANIEARTKFNFTPLHNAAISGQVNVVSNLLNKGANIEAKDTSNLTPLHYAASTSHGNVVSLLLEKGANIEAKDTINKTPLHSAAWNGRVNVVSVLLDKDANIEAKSTYNQTPLHYAASNGHVNVVSLLLDKGANIFAKGRWFRSGDDLTPLDMAKQKNKTEIVEILERIQRQLTG